MSLADRLAELIDGDDKREVAPSAIRNFVKQNRAELVKAMRCHEANDGVPSGEYPLNCWRSPRVKPPHLPDEHHSEYVLILLRDRSSVDGQRIAIGEVSVGHWRPQGGNGNFDDDVIGWMPLPKIPASKYVNCEEQR